MRRFTVTVNGTAYDVVVEEVSENAAPAAAPAPKERSVKDIMDHLNNIKKFI